MLRPYGIQTLFRAFESSHLDSAVCHNTVPLNKFFEQQGTASRMTWQRSCATLLDNTHEPSTILIQIRDLCVVPVTKLVHLIVQKLEIDETL